MTRPTIGYFSWRKDLRGIPRPSKILQEHRIKKIAGSSTERDEYNSNLLAEHPLNRYQWDNMSLADLASEYPAPEIKSDAERVNQAKPAP